MKKTNQECIFGNTPISNEENKEKNIAESIFKKNENRDNNPIRLKGNIFQSQIFFK